MTAAPLTDLSSPESDATSLPDRGERDRLVAANSYTTVVGRHAVPEALFRAYWRDVHGPLCSRVPGLDWYVQHHFAPGRDSHLWRSPAGVGPLSGYVLDGAVEIGWHSPERQSIFQDAASILFDDEQNVFEETVAYALPSGSTTVVDRSLDAAPNGTDRFDRIHVHLQPREGCAEALLEFALNKLGSSAVNSPEVVKLRVHGPDPHDNTTPNPPAPNVRHTVSESRAHLVIIEMAFVDALARRRFFATRSYGATLAQQAKLAASITAFPVSGVFTFVRGGQLTTAGLRGSGVAELIDGLAAVNQVAPSVTHLMRFGALDDAPL